MVSSRWMVVAVVVVLVLVSAVSLRKASAASFGDMPTLVASAPAPGAWGPPTPWKAETPAKWGPPTPWKSETPAKWGPPTPWKQ